MSSKLTLGGVILSLILNAILFGWLFQMNSQRQADQTALAEMRLAMESELSQNSQTAQEALTVANNARTQGENTGTLTRFAVVAITEQLSQLVNEDIVFNVPIAQEIPVATTVQLDENFEVPIQTNVPINTVVTVPVQLGVLGQIDLDVPLNLEVPVNLTVNVPIQKEIPINTVVPINMDVPVVISLQETALASQLEEWRTTLAQMGLETEPTP